MIPSQSIPSPHRTLGLRENWSQFTLLVLVNAFVGGMVGIERTVLPLLAREEFGLASYSATLSFIVSFGLVKAITNLFAGAMSEWAGRKRTLVVGWIIGLTVPLIIMLAPDWSWIMFANVLLGINQGLCWSTTVIMKIDLVGPVRCGLAMGLNEAAGYLAVAVASFSAGYLAAITNLRPEPFWLGIIFALAGLLISVFFVHETKEFAIIEANQRQHLAPDPTKRETFASIFLLTSWRNRNLFAVSQAGMINNLNDGMAWGLFPVFFTMAGLPLGDVSILVALYPAVWGILQLVTGTLSDHLGRKRLIVGGMLLQAIAIWILLVVTNFWIWAGASALLGLGTALVYPTLPAAIGDVAHPSWRATAVGVYRFWRDSGYVIGAVLAGFLADILSVPWSIGIVGGLTFGSGVLVALVMKERGATKSA